MSAFICGPEHFKALAIFAAERRPHSGDIRVNPRYIEGLDPEGIYALLGLDNLNPDELASLYADLLYRENIRSVLTRYPQDDIESAPGPIKKPAHITVTGRDQCAANLRLPPVSILKMCDCWEYQSCETDDWEQTPAYKLLNAIRRAAIRSLPGYEDAPWDYCVEDKAA